jgi:3-hydroxyisobutyrate dehydrogenase-like beta-hydroxyacid dehydrogenase
MFSDADAIRSVLFPENQNFNLAGKTIIQMATIAPEQSRQLANAVCSHHGKYIEAPVLGSTPEAEAGKLIIMAGGDPTLFSEIQPLLNALSPAPRLVGEVGSAAALKLAMNQLIASLTGAFSLSLGYALNNQVDLEVFMETVRASALYAPTYDKKLAKYLDRDFAGANFSTKHLLKDISLFLDGAKNWDWQQTHLTASRKLPERQLIMAWETRIIHQFIRLSTLIRQDNQVCKTRCSLPSSTRQVSTPETKAPVSMPIRLIRKSG